jgi:hypothetical protein
MLNTGREPSSEGGNLFDEWLSSEGKAGHVEIFVS